MTAPGAVWSDEFDGPRHDREPPPQTGAAQRLMPRLLNEGRPNPRGKGLLNDLIAKGVAHTPLERAR